MLACSNVSEAQFDPLGKWCLSDRSIVNVHFPLRNQVISGKNLFLMFQSHLTSFDRACAFQHSLVEWDGPSVSVDLVGLALSGQHDLAKEKKLMPDHSGSSKRQSDIIDDRK